MIDPDFLIANIYEAAAIPERWEKVLADFAKLAEGLGSILFVFGQKGPNWIASQDLQPIAKEWEKAGLLYDNSRSRRAIAARHPGFIREYDVFTEEELEKDTSYTEIYRPRGVGWGIGTMIPVPTGEVLVFHIERTFERGPVEQKYVDLLDRFRPHIARATLLTAQLRLQRAKAATDALDMIGIPAATLGPNGQIRSANAKFQALIPSVFQDMRERLSLVNSAADALLETALDRPIKFGDNGVHSIPLPAQGQHPPYILHLAPVAGEASDIFSAMKYLVIVTPVIPQKVPTAEVLQGLFDLTPAEARVARLIGEGRATNDIAALHGVSHETIRSQLKAVLTKTGLSRQIDLATLLAGKPLPGGSGA